MVVVKAKRMSKVKSSFFIVDILVLAICQIDVYFNIFSVPSESGFYFNGAFSADGESIFNLFSDNGL